MKYDKIQHDEPEDRNYNPDVYGEMIDDGSFDFDMGNFVGGEIRFEEGDDAMCESCECVNCSCGKKYESVRFDNYYEQAKVKNGE
jgi:hypothetical protein